MRITVKQLREMIRESVRQEMLKEYEQSIVRVGWELFKVDDDGNEEFYGEYDPDDPTYGRLEDGEGAPLERGYGGGGGYGRRDKADDDYYPAGGYRTGRRNRW